MYRESLLGFFQKTSLASERIALVYPTLVSTRFSVVPGFAPAGEASFGRAQDRLFVPAKGPKTIDAPSGLIEAVGRQPEESGPTRSAQTKPAN
ncbi:MAG: hypothetical protein H0W49_08140 [Nitrospirales bacterium]|nr:hypothetical protein [Nitrospirales bacterium]MBA3966139.1 hypothetical protein [Nitrospirales bacterium]